MMLGRSLLFCACAASLYAAIAAPAAMRRIDGTWQLRHPDLLESARRAVVAAAISLTAAALTLWYALFTRDFSIAYVSQVTSRATPVFYTFSGFWSSMDGSLLLWCWFLSLWAAAFVGRRRTETSPFIAFAIPPLALTTLWFTAVTALASSPFRTIDIVPTDGRGLNPLLQSPGMMIHPPMLYAGFTGLAVPFAVAVSAMASRRTGAEWLAVVRRWVLIPWMLLGVGMVLGGAWAYTELGWGGYWGWDPVENAALLPWLMATAFLHSAVIQQRRGMLKVWNIFLVVAAADLAVFGTFLTRSGLLSSVHTFAESPIGKWFFLALAAQTLVGLGMLVWRLPDLRSEHRMDSALSRESGFLVNNLLFVGAAFVILWGTVLPLISERLVGERLSVGPPFFNRIMSPLGALLLLLAAIGPVLPWRRGTLRRTAARLKIPAIAAAITGLGCLALTRNPAFGTLMFVAAFAAAVAVIEILRAAPGRSPRAIQKTITRNPTRFGGYLVHIGIAVMVLGFAGSLFRTQTEVAVSPGESFRFAGYTMKFKNLQRFAVPDKDINLAVVDVYRGSRKVITLRPQLNLHANFDQPQSEIAIRSTPAADLYVILAGTRLGSDETVFRVYNNPLVFWVWLGTALSLGGALVALLAGRRRAHPIPAPTPVRTSEPQWTP